MVVKLACAGGICDAVSVPLFSNTPPALLFRPDLHHARSDDADAGSGRVVDASRRPIGGGPDADA